MYQISDRGHELTTAFIVKIFLFIYFFCFRDINGRMYFLRLDVVLQGATFFIVFTDADTMPPPIRVDNYSEVLLTFAQVRITFIVIYLCKPNQYFYLDFLQKC